MVELVDTLDLGSSEAIRDGSSPSEGTMLIPRCVEDAPGRTVSAMVLFGVRGNRSPFLDKGRPHGSG